MRCREAIYVDEKTIDFPIFLLFFNTKFPIFPIFWIPSFLFSYFFEWPGRWTPCVIILPPRSTSLLYSSVASLAIIISINIIVSSVTVFACFLFVHQPGANHAPGASVTQVNHSVHTLSTFIIIIIVIIIIIIDSDVGVTKQSNAVTRNGVTRKRVTG